MNSQTLVFGGVDLQKKYGIFVEKRRDLLHPPVRERRVLIPGRDGSYDYGAEWYADRTVELECFSVLELSRERIRKLAYDLSGKKRLILSDEPEKYYTAQLYDPSVITYIGKSGSRYKLTFCCEPFACGAPTSLSLRAGENRIEYPGTARTPTLIVLHNDSPSEAANVMLRAVFKR